MVKDDPRVYVDYCRWKCEFSSDECSSENCILMKLLGFPEKEVYQHDYHR